MDCFEIDDLVCRRDTPGKRGRVCEFCPQTGRIRVKWPARRTWNKPDALIKILEPKLPAGNWQPYGTVRKYR